MKRALITGLLLSALSAPAAAWSPIAGHAPTYPGAARYALHQAGSADLGFAGTEPEVRRGMDDWTRVSCTSLRTTYAGSTTVFPNSFDGTSSIGWYESSWPHSGSAIGVTGPQYSGNDIFESDMEMNGVNFRWVTGAPSRGNDVNAYSIILHEAGHFYGLGHSNVPGSVMWPSYDNEIDSLGPDDQNGICALYPGSGTDCTVTGCPSGQECMGGTCQVIVGDGSVCSPCATSAECGSAGGLCLGYPGGAGFCGKACSFSNECGATEECVSTAGGGQCVRFDASGNPSCEGGAGGCTRDSDCATNERCASNACVPRSTTGSTLGMGCTSDAACQSNLCLGGRCTQSCDVLNATGSCPSGFYCDGEVLPACDVGYCVPGSPGSGAIGTPCSQDNNCSSLHCVEGACSQVCIPGGTVGCPADYACQVGTLACRGSCRGASGAPGDPCMLNADCTSSICASRGEDAFCTVYCSATTPCPDRFTCTSVGEGVSVCAPDFGGLGSTCAANEDCLSSRCAVAGDTSFCTRFCNDAPCPTGFSCDPVADGMTRVCRPTAPVSGGCGCHVGSRPDGAPFGLGLAGLIAVMIFRRRRRT